jgi:uncharacterized protein DUF6492
VDDLAVLTPCFRGDAALFPDLHESVLANTSPSVVHHVVVPPSDLRMFRQYEGPRCRVWTHRDLLPRYMVPVPEGKGLTVNLRRPWIPVRGWVTQQIVKIAGAAGLDARCVLIADSDAVLLREPTLDELSRNGRIGYFREDGAVSAEMERHVLWHNVAHRLLGVPGTVTAPAPDYVVPLAVWDPAVARAMTEHIAATTGRDWFHAVASELHVSEFVIYGVFADDVMGLDAALAGPLCHNYYERTPLAPADAQAFADRMPPSAFGSMTSSHSNTPAELRRETFRRCARTVTALCP